MALPRATVVIPCFNHGKFVGEAVRSALAQQDAEVRVVVVDDGSNDGETRAACDACAGDRVKVIHQENRGLPAARNRGVKESGGWGEYLVFLDADDWIEPRFVARLAEELGRAGEDASHAYCQERLVGHAKGTWTVPEWDPVLLLVTNLHPVTALVKRDRFEAVGGFEESMREGYEDWDLWLRMAARGWRGARVREPLFNWRRHSATTMVMEAVKKHERLFRLLMERHAEMYARHEKELVVISNVLLRRADANWLDENREAIFIRDLRAWNWDLVRERDTALAELAAARAELERMRRMPAPVRVVVRGLKRIIGGQH